MYYEDIWEPGKTTIVQFILTEFITLIAVEAEYDPSRFLIISLLSAKALDLVILPTQIIRAKTNQSLQIALVII